MKNKFYLIAAALISINSVPAHANEANKVTIASNHAKFCADLGTVDITDKVKVKNSNHVKDFVVCEAKDTATSLKASSLAPGTLQVVAPSGKFTVETDSDGSTVYITPPGIYSYTGEVYSQGYATVNMSVEDFCSEELYMPMFPLVFYISMTCYNKPTAEVMVSKMTAYAPPQSRTTEVTDEGIVTYNE
ncbi:MAG: hypothetical protein QG673_988 [Pseudomonadota bacterium]|nr:hypothetical protein [Pseudomonadota bacterium]